jgi:hypothetical protein
VRSSVTRLGKISSLGLLFEERVNLFWEKSSPKDGNVLGYFIFKHLLSFGYFLNDQGNLFGEKVAKKMVKFWATFCFSIYFHFTLICHF